MKLYELRQDYQRLQALAVEAASDPDVRQALEDTLSGLTGEIEDKVHACCVVVRELEAQAEAFRIEGERMKARREALEHNADRLRAYMTVELALMDLRSVRTPLFSVTLQENKPRLVLDPTVDMPPEYMVQLPKTDNARIREALERGEQIQGAHLEPSKSVRIR